MAKRLQLRRGTTAEHSTFTGALGEVTVDTTKDVIVVHDGATVGGFPSASRANADGSISLIKKDGTSAGSINSTGLFNNTLTSTNTNQALTAAQGKVLNDQAFGVNQSTQDVTGDRAINTVYTNTTGKPIFVFIVTYDMASTTFLKLDNVVIGTLDSSLVMDQSLSFTVRVGGTYELQGVAPLTIKSWVEVK
jgi:hypothetical protein